LIVAPLLIVILMAAIGVAWRRMRKGHDARMRQLELRVHVNGIRGKSTVTRLIAAMLREGGFVTIAKTTGSAARVIGPAGEETPIRRRGAATINEQVDTVSEHVTPDVEALVIECMAVNPVYQRYSQEFIVQSDVTVITNVREDHQEVMGETLEEIADSMSVTIPSNGILITAEERPHLRERLARNATARGSTFRYADPSQVTDADMRPFSHLEFKSNVAVALELARVAGIDRNVALRGRWKAVPDVGAVHLRRYEVRGTDVLWIPLFAANDRESVVSILETLQGPHLSGRKVIGILNNRQDRGRRAELFAEMVPRDLAPFLDRVVTFGAYEAIVTRRMTALGYAPERITNLGETVDPGIDRILDTISGLADGMPLALVGLVNIHTPQAEQLLAYFDGARGGNDGITELDLSRHEDRLPNPVRRHRNLSRKVLLRRVPDDA
jgi:poly-gamma-glutamate synthase PgsB/CapB